MKNPSHSNEYSAQIPKVQSLFTKVFKRIISIDYLRWRYVENPLNITLASTEIVGSEMISHAAATPNYFLWRDQKWMAGMVAAVMSDPECQGRGLFQKMVTTLEGQMREKTFHFAYAFPNRNSDPIFLTKLGWIPIAEIPTIRWEMPQSLENGSVPSLFEWREDPHFELPGYDELATGTMMKNYLHIPRTKEFLKWRYSANPAHSYSNFALWDPQASMVTTFAIVKRYEFDGQIQLDWVDYSMDSPDSCEILMDRVRMAANEFSAEAVNVWALRSHPLYAGLLKRGAQFNGSVTHLSAKFFNLTSLQHLEARAGLNWWITMGDSDVY